MRALLCYGTTLYGPTLISVADKALAGEAWAQGRAVNMLRTIGESLTEGDLQITGENTEMDALRARALLPEPEPIADWLRRFMESDSDKPAPQTPETCA